MNQSQFELFPDSSNQASKYPDTKLLSGQIRSVTLSPENFIIFAIALIMVGILFFSFGVERGRRLSSNLGDSSLVNTEVSEGPTDIEETSTASEAKAVMTAPKTSSQEKLDKNKNKAIKESPLTDKEAPAGGVFTIQVASYKSKASAQKEATNLKKKGHETFVLEKGSHAILCIGRFKVQTEAKRFSNSLKNKYNDCLVRRL